MPTFDTPEPITAVVQLDVGDLRIGATERGDTVVEVLPADPARRDDVIAAEKAQVEYRDGQLLVRRPGGLRRFSPFNDGGAIDVRIALPAGSQLTATAAIAAVHVAGRLGDCRVSTSLGDITLDEVADLRVDTDAGTITVQRVTGAAEVRTNSGATRIAALERGGSIKTSNGASWIGEAGADVRVSGANGAITVERARGDVVAKNANGDIRVGELTAGSVSAASAMGSLTIGVARGVSAWLDLSTGFGRVDSELEPAASPPAGQPTVRVRARTGYGDVTVRHPIHSHPEGAR